MLTPFEHILLQRTLSPPHLLMFFQSKFPVLSGGEYVAAAKAGGRIHGLPEPWPILPFDTVDDQFHIVLMSAQRQSGEWNDVFTQVRWEPIQ